MRKSLLTFIAIVTITNCYSQTEKGKKIIGGQFNLSSYNYSDLDTLFKFDRNYLEFQIVPSFGYFIKDNFAIGVNLNFGFSNSTEKNANSYNTLTETTAKANSISYGGGGFARYYKKIADKFFFYANGEVAYTYKVQKSDYSTSNPNYVYPPTSPAHQEVQYNTISVEINPGLVYFATPKLGIQTSFGDIFYNNSTSKNISLLHDNHNNSHNYGISLNMRTFYLGINYYF
jgi:hypothetical protein